jgi:hypothetical protein
MASLFKITALWQNWPGAPGYTNFYVLEAGPITTATDGIRAFFDAIKGVIPSGITITVQPSGDQINDTNGNITGAWSVDPAPAVVTGSAAGTYAGNAGGVVSWRTNGVVANRRVRGRSFLVPLASTVYDTNGLTSAAIATLQGAASGLVTAVSPNLAVWSRPTQLRSGSSHPVTSATVPDLSASLRSRRR